MRIHSGCQKCFDRFTLPRQNECRKALVPLSGRHLWFGVQPTLQCVKIGDLDAAFTKATLGLDVPVLSAKHDFLKLCGEAKKFAFVVGFFDAF